jgi:predicted transcriptional regulator
VPTTTIRIEDELKARIAAVAEEAGTTPHAFLIEAISQRVEQAEAEAELRRIAERRWRAYAKDGLSVPWDEARTWLVARASGKPAPRPKARRRDG